MWLILKACSTSRLKFEMKISIRGQFFWREIAWHHIFISNLSLLCLYYMGLYSYSYKNLLFLFGWRSFFFAFFDMFLDLRFSFFCLFIFDSFLAFFPTIRWFSSWPMRILERLFGFIILKNKNINKYLIKFLIIKVLKLPQHHYHWNHFQKNRMLCHFCLIERQLQICKQEHHQPKNIKV